MFAAELRRIAGGMNSPARQCWHETLAGACVCLSDIARRTCKVAASRHETECSLRISEFLAKDPRLHELQSKFPETGMFLETDEDDLVLQGFYLATLEGRDGEPDGAGGKQVYCNSCSLVIALAPLLSAELRSAGVAVEVQAVPISCGGWSQEAPDLLVLSWSAVIAPTVAGVGNVVRSCGVCHETKSMEALLPCGHLLCTVCRQRVGAMGCCPFCRCRAIGVQALFAP